MQQVEVRCRHRRRRDGRAERWRWRWRRPGFERASSTAPIAARARPTKLRRARLGDRRMRRARMLMALGLWPRMAADAAADPRHPRSRDGAVAAVPALRSSRDRRGAARPHRREPRISAARCTRGSRAPSAARRSAPGAWCELVARRAAAARVELGDGRASRAAGDRRRRARIAAARRRRHQRIGWCYAQTGIVCTIAHERPHAASRMSGSCRRARSPCCRCRRSAEGHRSSIVWTERSERRRRC